MYSTWLILLCCLYAITGATGATTGDEYGSTSHSGIFTKVSSSLEVQGSISGEDVVWLMKRLGFKECHHEENGHEGNGHEGHEHEGHGDEKEDKSPCNLVCMIFLFLLIWVPFYLQDEDYLTFSYVFKGEASILMASL